MHLLFTRTSAPCASGNTLQPKGRRLAQWARRYWFAVALLGWNAALAWAQDTSGTAPPDGSMFRTWGLWILLAFAILANMALVGGLIWCCVKVATDERKGRWISGIAGCVFVMIVELVMVPFMINKASTILNGISSGFNSSMGG